jgi:hypothetical protein
MRLRSLAQVLSQSWSETFAHGIGPSNAEQAAGHITRPLRGNGTPYRGINVLVLWSSAIDSGYAARIWMNYRQAAELKAQVPIGQGIFRDSCWTTGAGAVP